MLNPLEFDSSLPNELKFRIESNRSPVISRWMEIEI